MRRVWFGWMVGVLVLLSEGRSEAFRCQLNIPEDAKSLLNRRDNFVKLFSTKADTEYAAWVLGQGDSPLWVESPQTSTKYCQSQLLGKAYRYEVKTFSFLEGREKTLYTSGTLSHPCPAMMGASQKAEWVLQSQISNQKTLQIRYLDWRGNEGSYSIPQFQREVKESNGVWQVQTQIQTQLSIGGTPELWKEKERIFDKKSAEETYHIAPCRQEKREFCLTAELRMSVWPSSNMARVELEEPLGGEVSSKLREGCKITVQSSDQQLLLNCGTSWAISISRRFVRRALLHRMLERQLNECRAGGVAMRPMEALRLQRLALASQYLVGQQKQDFPSQHLLGWAELHSLLGKLGNKTVGLQVSLGKQHWHVFYQIGLRLAKILPLPTWKSREQWRRMRGESVVLWPSFQLSDLSQVNLRAQRDKIKHLAEQQYGIKIHRYDSLFPSKGATVHFSLLDRNRDRQKELNVEFATLETTGDIHLKLSYALGIEEHFRSFSGVKIKFSLQWKDNLLDSLQMEGEATFGTDWQEVGEKREVLFSVQESFLRDTQECLLEVKGAPSQKITRARSQYLIFVDTDKDGNYAYRCAPIIGTYRKSDRANIFLQ